MATKELLNHGKPESIQNQAMTMALAILTERIRGLPKEDKNDLYGLVKEIFSAETEEEFEEAVIGVHEILDQEPVLLRQLDCTEPVSDELNRWLSFVSGRILEFRKQANMTQKDLAEKSGLPQSHISRLESGKHSPSRRTLERIADALSVRLADLDPSA